MKETIEAICSNALTLVLLLLFTVAILQDSGCTLRTGSAEASLAGTRAQEVLATCDDDHRAVYTRIGDVYFWQIERTPVVKKNYVVDSFETYDALREVCERLRSGGSL